jgi:hypothetical protein
MKTKQYPDWICSDCGHKAQPDKRRIFTVSTFHHGRCGVCGETKAVTELRDFGWPTMEMLLAASGEAA